MIVKRKKNEIVIKKKKKNGKKLVYIAKKKKSYFSNDKIKINNLSNPPRSVSSKPLKNKSLRRIRREIKRLEHARIVQ